MLCHFDTERRISAKLLIMMLSATRLDYSQPHVRDTLTEL
jgi:hypothetical protein